MSSFVGIDIAKDKFDVALLADNKFKHKVFKNKQEGFVSFSVWLKRQHSQSFYFCMEASGVYGEDLALFLYKEGYTISIVNPARIKGFSQSELSRTKTDKTDAKLIARFCQAMQPKAWTPPLPEVRELQAIARRIEALQNMRTQEVNRLHVATPIVASSIKEHIEYLPKNCKYKNVAKNRVPLPKFFLQF